MCTQFMCTVNKLEKCASFNLLLGVSNAQYKSRVNWDVSVCYIYSRCQNSGVSVKRCKHKILIPIAQTD